jgi:hypothetical protein
MNRGRRRSHHAILLLPTAEQHLTCATSPNLAATCLARSAHDIKMFSMVNSLIQYSATFFCKERLPVVHRS